MFSILVVKGKFVNPSAVCEGSPIRASTGKGGLERL